MGSPARPDRKVIFNLKREWEVEGKIVDLYEEIKSGRKTSEWRYAHKEDGSITRYAKLLVVQRGRYHLAFPLMRGMDMMEYIRTHRAWFVVGYPKGSLPRLEADISGLVYHADTDQLEVKIANVVEVLS